MSFLNKILRTIPYEYININFDIEPFKYYEISYPEVSKIDNYIDFHNNYISELYSFIIEKDSYLGSVHEVEETKLVIKNNKIYSLFDEYFLVRVENNYTSRLKFYYCDGIDGLIQYLNDFVYNSNLEDKLKNKYVI